MAALFVILLSMTIKTGSIWFLKHLSLLKNIRCVTIWQKVIWVTSTTLCKSNKEFLYMQCLCESNLRQAKTKWSHSGIDRVKLQDSIKAGGNWFYSKFTSHCLFGFLFWFGITAYEGALMNPFHCVVSAQVVAVVAFPPHFKCSW